MKFSLLLLVLMVTSTSMAMTWTKLEKPTPAQYSKKLYLWATGYYTPNFEYSETLEYPFLDPKGEKLGPTLNQKEWCNAGLQGAASFTKSDGTTLTVTFDSLAEELQVDCSKYFTYTKTGKIRFKKADGPYGDGFPANNILVPYRTIAVDPAVIPSGSVVYIPKAVGIKVTLPTGEIVEHDGYFYAADVGGAIKGNHIDLFLGTQFTSVFKIFLKSKPTPLFKAYLMKNKEILQYLQNEHSLATSSLKNKIVVNELAPSN